MYFAAGKKHISLYPAPVSQPVWKTELLPVAKGASTAQFPLDKPVPLRLVRKVVKFLMQENAARVQARAAPRGQRRTTTRRRTVTLED